MAQVFPRSANWASKASILVGFVLVGSILGILLNINRIYFVNQVNVPIDQPVPFSHKHHVTGMGIDCRYCHTTVEESAFAGVPPTETCMTCHSQIWTEAPILEPVRASFRDNVPIEWNRVHDLPDFAYFNHSIHVNQGIGCQSCHGQVDQMPLMWKAESLNMESQHIRPRDQVFNMTYQYPPDQESLGAQLVAEYGVQTSQLTNCSICHR
ncbi:MAG: cytochrome c3 family protein [Candidatus Latescibacteria bacterium]|nr:cytochrome c3 family protein [Candidatus Latescibacterota bacterium]